MTTATLGDSGIVLGGVDEYGVHWRWQAGSDPWSPGPNPRSVRGARGGAHGDWSATEFYESRSQELAVLVTAPSHAELHHAQQRWMAAIGLTPFWFVVDEPHFGRRQSLMARDGRPTWTEETPGTPAGGAVARATASLIADDPLIYATSTTTASTTLPSTVGGLEWPATWPATWDAVVTGGPMRAVNAGSEATSVLWRIDGPVTYPMVTHVRTGRRMRLAMDLGLGDWVTIDTSTRQVLAKGQRQASRRTLWSGDWLDLPPGVNEFVLSAAAGGPEARLTASWRHAWI